MKACDSLTLRPRCGWRIASAVFLCSAAVSVQSQESSPLAQGSDVVQMPGIGRVIFAFLLVAALAVAIIFALRKVLPRIGATLPGSALRVVDRANVNAGLRVHVVEIEGERVLIAESRSGVALLPLASKRGEARANS
jgi:flagellar biogenesis protein FliO